MKYNGIKKIKVNFRGFNKSRFVNYYNLFLFLFFFLEKERENLWERAGEPWETGLSAQQEFDRSVAQTKDRSNSAISLELYLRGKRKNIFSICDASD